MQSTPHVRSAVSKNSERLNMQMLTLHQHRANLGEIWINGDIDNGVIEMTVMRLLNLAQTGNYSRILLFINSTGGFISDGQAVIDTVACLPIPVWTINLGAAFSMGLSIFLSGERRFAMPGAAFMAHCMSYGNNGSDKLYEHEEFAKFNSGVQKKQQAKFYASRSNKSEAFWLAKFKGANFWFDTDKAVDLGIATDIVGKENFGEIFGDIWQPGREVKSIPGVI